MEPWNSPTQSPKNPIEQGRLTVAVRANHDDSIGIEIECLPLRETAEPIEFK